MPCNIPTGWYYAGAGHTHTSHSDAIRDINNLKKIFIDDEFDIIPDTRGGEGYERYIIITNVDPFYGKHKDQSFRKIKKSTSNIFVLLASI